MKRLMIIPAILLLAAFSCAEEKGTGFDASSALGFVKKQVEFGPRVPNTPAHAACADWLVKTLKQWTPDVVVQAFQAKAYDGRILDGKNIVASFNAEAKDRILLCAHWDSRPFADHDPDPANHFKPVMGANVNQTDAQCQWGQRKDCSNGCHELGTYTEGNSILD